MNETNLDNTDYYINRELSLLNFNWRVLAQAQDQSLPLLERLKFLFICSGNLDEFFEVRVAGLKQQIAFNSTHMGPDGLTPQAILNEISLRAHELVEEQYKLLNEDLRPKLREQGLRFLQKEEWTDAQREWVKNYFHNEILPVISPIALDIAHPFPRLVNKSLNFIVTVEGKDDFGRSSGLAIVHAPRSIPRVTPLPNGSDEQQKDFVFLTSIIKAHVGDLFPGMTVTGCYQFRVTRNSDLLLDEDEIEDLALALKTGLLTRRYGNAVRLEIAAECPQELADYLLQKHNLNESELYRVDGPVNLSRFMMFLKLVDRPDLRFTPFTPGLPEVLRRRNNLFEVMREHDILLHHPYQSFEPVIDLIRQATVDPDVLAIKQTLYRTGAGSKMVLALADAARAGKEVTAVIELRARFDEAFNIELATRLQEAGALVVYGVVGYKTHAKMTLIVRREKNILQRYVHLGTGNYHARTAREYTDIGLLTSNIDIGNDVQLLFQQLTSMGKALKTKQLLHSPFILSKTLLSLIEDEIKLAKTGKPARIIAKMNALTDPQIIQALYRASQAGVQIDLIIRGICCLRPGIPGVSENIHVRSIVGRFLEHSRIFYFHHEGKQMLYCGSADWMERNLYHRVEVCFPIKDKQLKKAIIEDFLALYLDDNLDAWILQKDGSYRRNKQTKANSLSAQKALLTKLAD